ncbi:MAG: hypothetical protein AAB909_02965 [Patescibacteria group bacterium]|mgnify:CR=1 FL=1
MSNELIDHLKANYPTRNSVRLIDSGLEAFSYRPTSNTTRWLYRAYYECDAYPFRSLFDTATVLAQVLCGLNQTDCRAVSLTNLTNPTLTDYGLEQAVDKNKLTSDLDPALVSPRSNQDIYAITLAQVKTCIDYRNQFPPRDIYQYAEDTSRWPEIAPIVQVQHIDHHYRERNVSTAVEFHPLSSAQNSPEETLREYLTLFAPYYVGRLGLNILATSAERTSDEEDMPFYPAFHHYDPRFAITETIYSLRPKDINNTSVYLSIPEPSPRLAASIGPRVCLAATLAETHTKRHHDIDPDAKAIIAESVAKWGAEHQPVIDKKIAGMHKRAATIQKWHAKLVTEARDYPKYARPLPKHPDPEPNFVKTLDRHLKSVGY